MADAYGSGPYGSDTVWVQVPSPASRKKVGREGLPFFVLKQSVPRTQCSR